MKSMNVQFSEQYDVIVVGAGPAGIGAAVAAGRGGAKTLLVDQCGSVGGMSTVGLMSHFTGTVGNRIYREILDRAKEKYFYDPGEDIFIDPELLKIVYYEMLEEAGVTVLLYTFVCDAVMDGQTVKGVVCENKSGRKIFRADVVVDCSGDGDLAYRSGIGAARRIPKEGIRTEKCSPQRSCSKSAEWIWSGRACPVRLKLWCRQRKESCRRLRGSIFPILRDTSCCTVRPFREWLPAT